MNGTGYNNAHAQQTHQCKTDEKASTCTWSIKYIVDRRDTNDMYMTIKPTRHVQRANFSHNLHSRLPY